MNYSTSLAAVFLTLSMLIPASAQQLYSISLPKTLIAVDDKLYIAAGFSEPGNAVDIKKQTRLVHYQTKKAITYSLGGDTPSVTLSDGKAVSEKWDLSKVTEKSPGGPVIATEGKFSGWYLDWSEDETEIDYKGKKIKVK